MTEIDKQAREYADGVFINLSPNNTERNKVTDAAYYDFLAGAQYERDRIVGLIEEMIESIHYNTKTLNDLKTKITNGHQ